ncbi:MAG: hypothetical protein JWM85_1062 [Acidimicrobiaceae bacterium]|nr:hypothetical protein [Acidimicrobiaceae bacterium]
MLATVTVADWASIAVAGATLVLAVFTAASVAQARRAADAAVQEAAATLQLAGEAARDRQLTWQPWLVKSGGQALPMEHTYVEQGIQIMNVGAGPALALSYVSRDESDLWCYLDPIDMGAGGRVGPSNTRGGGNLPPEVFTADGERIRSVLLCSDVFGNRYRFALRGEWSPPDVWRIDDSDKPAWVDWRP